MNKTRQHYDLVVIGGGINGAGIARDAAGRGLRVLLCERDDLAAHTSSASTKLIHGGLRYLEYFELRLVRKALREREILLRAAPHIIRPIRFVIPHSTDSRPRWMLRIGLFLYDRLGNRRMLPPSQALDLRRHVSGASLKPTLRHAHAYSDCWGEDARLVVLNALDAAERGAHVRTRTTCIEARRASNGWVVRLRDGSGHEEFVRSSGLVNAAGPWTSRLLEREIGIQRTPRVRLVKGSHIVVPALFDHDHAYMLQNEDGRLCFVIPFEGHFTLIGTTDEILSGEPDHPTVSRAETNYLCSAVNRWFRAQIEPEDVVWSFSGVRPLHDDAAVNASAVTRDYVLDLDSVNDSAPLLSVFGGKITTYRRLAEEAMNMLAPLLAPKSADWTAHTPLPGGDIPNADFEAWLPELRHRYGFLPEALLQRLGRGYGTRIHALLGDAGSLQDLGADLGHGLYEAELRYLQRHEWAVCAEDVLWRRTRLGLHVPAETAKAVQAWFEGAQRPAPRARHP